MRALLPVFNHNGSKAAFPLMCPCFGEMAPGVWANGFIL